MKRILIYCWLILQWGCASQAPPSGGPEDKTAPEIVTTLPEHDSTRVGRSTAIAINFSERMNKLSTEKAIFISPTPAGNLGFSWSKNTLFVTLPDSLSENVTCVVTVGTDAKDIHDNAISKSYSFAFSTGDSIDRGEISGRVISETTKGVSIWAYRLRPTGSTQVTEDSMIYKKRADYITQVSADGAYHLSFLAPGRYRVFAVADLDEDFVYSTAADAIGIPSKDVELTSGQPTFAGMDFMMTAEDSSRFGLQSVTSINPKTTLAGLTKPLSNRYFENRDSFDDVKNHLELIDSSDGKIIPIKDAYVNTLNKIEIKILTEPLDVHHRYTLKVHTLYSSTGDTLTTGEQTFDVYQSDAVRAIIELVQPKEISSIVLPNDFFAFRFDKGMPRDRLEQQLMLLDSSGQKTSGTFKWWNSSYVEFHPSKFLESQMAYRLELNANSLPDWEGLVTSDTAVVFPFVSFKKDSLGIISGQIFDQDSTESQYIIVCRSLSKGRNYTVTLEKAGVYSIPYIVPGKYNILGYRDADHNDQYSFGNIAPIRFAERFTAYADTVAVRPNWETANIHLRFKK
ncbi:Ig-like domain-containing protein [bacterium]|nr:Ig-like domain-containing protein [bacterium]